MPRLPSWRALTLAFAAVLAVAPAACRDDHGGMPSVVVIGGEPKIRDPASAALSGPDSVMLGAVAQGLVQFDATGNIVPGLAERWNVSDDGLSYIFRIASTDWSTGRKVSAQQVARVLKRAISPAAANPLKDTLGAVEDVVAMTDRVIEIRLRAPRPNLLALLAQPEFAIVRNGAGTGPFKVEAERGTAGELRLTREVLSAADDEAARRDELLLRGQAAADAVRSFADGKADLVLGGTFADLPTAQSAKLPRGSLRFDPAMGLFGLVPVRPGGELEDADVRRLLSQAIDRDALVAALRVPGLAARATVLEPALEGVADPSPPAWLATPLDQRHAALVAEATRLFGSDKPTLRLLLPAGPGADILFNRLASDWALLGIAVERAKGLASADLRLVDAVAPSTSPAWFLRQFRCGVAPVCDPEADTLLDAARVASVPAQRGALLAQAAARIDQSQLFLPITAPVRWALVSNRIQGFAGNRYARHTLTDLDQKIGSGG
jgi:peptide/nickel transport system substrate-binding protein